MDNTDLDTVKAIMMIADWIGNRHDVGGERVTLAALQSISDTTTIEVDSFNDAIFKFVSEKEEAINDKEITVCRKGGYVVVRRVRYDILDEEKRKYTFCSFGNSIDAIEEAEALAANDEKH